MPALGLFLSFHYVRKLMVCSKIINIRIYFFLNKWWYNVIYKQVLLCPDAFVSEAGTEVTWNHMKNRDDSKPTSHSHSWFLFSSQAEPAEVVARQRLLSHKTESLACPCSGKGSSPRTHGENKAYMVSAGKSLSQKHYNQHIWKQIGIWGCPASEAWFSESTWVSASENLAVLSCPKMGSQKFLIILENVGFLPLCTLFLHI